MNIKNIENIVNGIVENEFTRIQETTELDFENESLEYNQTVLMTKILRKTLTKELTEEQQRLIGEFEDSINSEWLELCEFYFREGLRAGLTNLKFLKEIEPIDYYL